METETLARVAGEVRAVRFVLGAVIATHPDPQQLLEFFEQALPEWTDKLATDPTTTTHPAFHSGVQDALSALRSVLVASQPRD